MNACPVCGETAIHHERVYVINGQRVVMKFAACLHTPPAALPAQPTPKVQ